MFLLPIFFQDEWSCEFSWGFRCCWKLNFYELSMLTYCQHLYIYLWASHMRASSCESFDKMSSSSYVASTSTFIIYFSLPFSLELYMFVCFLLAYTIAIKKLSIFFPYFFVSFWWAVARQLIAIKKRTKALSTIFFKIRKIEIFMWNVLLNKKKKKMGRGWKIIQIKIK